MDRSNTTISNEEHGEQSHLIVWQVQCPLPMPINGQPMNEMDKSDLLNGLAFSMVLHVSSIDHQIIELWIIELWIVNR